MRKTRNIAYYLIQTLFLGESLLLVEKYGSLLYWSDAETALRPALGEWDSGIQVEVNVRSEPRLTVSEACLGFIADSLFSATLTDRAGRRGRTSGFLGRVGGR
jgi:hypothetical protein